MLTSTRYIPLSVVGNDHLNLSQAGIMGHSMGGHGALTLFLKNSNTYKSVSAFAPICNPVNVQWGHKAFSGYLGKDESTWKQYDATELVKQYSGPKVQVLIDVGTDDNFKDKQLTPEVFAKAAEGKLDVNLRIQVSCLGSVKLSLLLSRPFSGYVLTHVAPCRRATTTLTSPFPLSSMTISTTMPKLSQPSAVVGVLQS